MCYFTPRPAPVTRPARGDSASAGTRACPVSLIVECRSYKWLYIEDQAVPLCVPVARLVSSRVRPATTIRLTLIDMPASSIGCLYTEYSSAAKASLGPVYTDFSQAPYYTYYCDWPCCRLLVVYFSAHCIHSPSRSGFPQRAALLHPCMRYICN